MDLRLPYYMMYPIPYAFDEDKIQKRDREYLQSMYPATAKKIFPYIQEECNRQEYEGSMIYDEYPDKLQLCLMCRRALYVLYNNYIYNVYKDGKYRLEGGA